MIAYTGNIDHELLRQELDKAGLPEGWYLTGYQGYVEYIGESEDVAGPIIVEHIANADKREANKAILKQIEELEATATPRRIRESLTDPTWMKALDAQIAVLRGQLQ